MKLADVLARRAHETLRDGEWHDREQLTRDLMRLVPPGPALRRADRDREVSWLADHPGEDVVPPRTRFGDVEARIRTGSRTIVNRLLSGPAYERRVVDGVKQIRATHAHRATKSDPFRRRIDALEAENERLRAEVAFGDVAREVVGTWRKLPAERRRLSAFREVPRAGELWRDLVAALDWLDEVVGKDDGEKGE